MSSSKQDETEVTWEDQDRINSYGKLNKKVQELRQKITSIAVSFIYLFFIYF